MAIDHRVLLAGQVPDMASAVNNGLADGAGLAKLIIGSQVNRMRDIDDANERKAFADKNILGRHLRAQLKQDDAAAYQAQLAQQKALADISKTQSEAYKNTTQGQGYGLDNAKQLMQNADRALIAAAQTGDPLAAKLALNNARKAGAIDDATFQQYSNQIDALGTNPEALKQFAQSIVFASAKDPAALIYTSADNRLDNDTSRQNAQLSAETSRYGTDVNANVQREKLAQDQAQFDAEAYIKQNQPIDYFTAADGTRYAVYANGQGIPISNAQGEAIKATAPKVDASVRTGLAELQGANDQLTNTIQTLERAKELSRQGIYDGAFSSSRADLAGTFFGGTEESRRTQEYNNIVTQQALSSLKAVFGGSPTEGERAMLLKVQASSDYPPQVRESILNEAIAMAQKKIESNNRQAQILSGGKQTTQTPSQVKGATTSLADVKAAAKQAGVSVDEMVNILQRQGVTVR